MKKIGITGGIGAGKSLVCKIFEVMGIPHYPADSRAKWLQVNDASLKNDISSLLGEKAYQPNGALDREFISKIVFSDSEKLQALNALVHPAVAQDFKNWCKAHTQKPFILKEAALLFETGSYHQLDATILVHAPYALRLERTLARDAHRTREDIEKIMKQQMPETEKLQLATFVIQNDEKSSLIKACKTLFEQIRG